MRHPSQVLFSGEKPLPILPAVDHYAGSEKLMKKALQLQNELGPIFDITCDCEDGAHAGAVLGLSGARETESFLGFEGKVEIDYTSHELGKACRQLLDGNGHQTVKHGNAVEDSASKSGGCDSLNRLWGRRVSKVHHIQRAIGAIDDKQAFGLAVKRSDFGRAQQSAAKTTDLGERKRQRRGFCFGG